MIDAAVSKYCYVMMHLKNCVVVSSIKLNLNATKMGMHMILNDLSHKWDQNTPYNAVPNAQIIFRNNSRLDLHFLRNTIVLFCIKYFPEIYGNI